MSSSRFVVYCLQSVLRPSCTYVGASVDALHRLRQHNGELVGGARYTSRFRPWRHVFIVRGFVTWRECLRFEWWLKRVSRRSRASSAVLRRKSALRQLIDQSRFHSKWSASAPLLTIDHCVSCCRSCAH